MLQSFLAVLRNYATVRAWYTSISVLIWTALQMPCHRNPEMHLGESHAAFPYLKQKKKSLCVSKLKSFTDHASSRHTEVINIMQQFTYHKRVTRYSNSCNLSKRSYYRLCLSKCSKTCSLERQVENINTSNQSLKTSLLQLPHKSK